jgi:hypothetical protein
MTAQDFVKNYIMHDSLIDNIEISDHGTKIIMLIDFAFWMQAGYDDTDPETGPLKITFRDVSESNIPNNINWDEISILETESSNGTVTFKLINDMTDAYLDLNIQSNNISVERG